MPKLCSWWNLPPLASANYVSPGPVNDSGGLQPSELCLYHSIHCSLIGRVLVLWILLEWRCCFGAQLMWLQARTNLGIFYCLVWWKEVGRRRTIVSWRGLATREDFRLILTEELEKTCVTWTLEHLVCLSSLKQTRTLESSYRNFDVKHLASFKSEKFSLGNDNAFESEGYILGTGMTTYAIFPLWVLQLATIPLNLLLLLSRKS